MAVQTFTSGQILTAADTNTYLANSGLVYITQATIGTGVSTAAVANCFSSTYDNYKVIVNGGVGSTVQALGLSLTGSAAGYYGSTIVAAYSAAVATSNGMNNIAQWTFAGVSGPLNNFLNVDLLGPNIAKATGASGAYINPSTVGNGGIFAGYHDSLFQATGLTISVSGTMTGGTITVYGYRKA
jgi:hypothetical protein